MTAAKTIKHPKHDDYEVVTRGKPPVKKKVKKLDPELEAALTAVDVAEAPMLPEEMPDEAPAPKTTKVAKLKPAKKERSKTTKGHYVSNKELLEEFLICKANNGKLSNKMGRYLELVAERYSYHPWFANYSFREDMVRTAVVNLVANWHKFNPEKQENPNPFSYYTTASYRSFLSYLDAERKERDIRDELLIEAGANPSFNYQSKHGISGRTSDDTAFSGGGGSDE